MAVRFRVEKSHHRAVERLAVTGAESVAALGAAPTAVPIARAFARLHECDAERHEAEASYEARGKQK
jgi:hypothetical protein